MLLEFIEWGDMKVCYAETGISGMRACRLEMWGQGDAASVASQHIPFI